MPNRNPLTSIEHIRSLLSQIQTYGEEAIANLGYMISLSKVSIQELPVFPKLCSKLSNFFGPFRHVVLMYGSSSGPGNCLFSDINMMAFADDDFCTPNKV